MELLITISLTSPTGGQRRINMCQLQNEVQFFNAEALSKCVAYIINEHYKTLDYCSKYYPINTTYTPL